jgi:hypothetical protein
MSSKSMKNLSEELNENMLQTHINEIIIKTLRELYQAIKHNLKLFKTKLFAQIKFLKFFLLFTNL